MTDLKLALRRTVKDPIVRANMLALAERSQVGQSKYGVGLDRPDLTIRVWQQHLMDELLDAVNYLKVLMEKDPVEELSLTWHERHDEDVFKDGDVLLTIREYKEKSVPYYDVVRVSILEDEDGELIAQFNGSDDELWAGDWSEVTKWAMLPGPNYSPNELFKSAFETQREKASEAESNPPVG